VRERLYFIGALAQSFVPRGVADLLNLSVKGQVRRRARPLRERVLLYALLAVELACGGVLVWGIATSDVVIVLVGAGAFLVLLLGTAAMTVLSEQRRRSVARHAREEQG
jgi:hypothetical protein